MAYGMSGHLNWCFQNSFGTSLTDSCHSVPILSESLKEEIPPLISESIKGRMDVGDMYEGPHSVAGDVNMETHPIYTGLALKGWCGASSSTLVTSHYSHTFVAVTEDWIPNKCAVQPITLEIDRDSETTSSHMYTDCCVDALNIEIAHGELIKFNASMIGAGFEWSAPLTPAYEVGSAYAWDQTSISVSGGGVDYFKSVSLNLSNNLEASFTLNGNKTPSRILRTAPRTGELTATALFESNTALAYWRAQAIFNMEIHIIGQEISSGYTADLGIYLPSILTGEYTTNITGTGKIEATAAYQVQYNSGSGHIAKFTLTNTQASY